MEIIRREGSEIREGFLHCTCGQKYAIIRGVPRMLTNAFDRKLEEVYPGFIAKDRALSSEENPKTVNAHTAEKLDTIDRFGYEWTYFSDYACDNFEPFVSHLPNGFFNGTLGLDVGCGAGRHVHLASEKGVDSIIGIDLSNAVDTAYDNNSSNDRVHIVQTDVFKLPFRERTFDFIYSLGVLHHVPSPKAAYLSLRKYLKPGGALFVWLYAYGLRKVALESLRFIAKYFSSRSIRRMAFLCNLLDYGVFVTLYRFFRQIPYIGPIIQRVAPLRIKEYAEYGYHVSYTDWYDRLSAPITNYYKDHEMRNWLASSALCSTRLIKEGDSWWWLYGERENR